MAISELEEQFGRFDSETGQDVGGLDIIRNVTDQELDDLKQTWNIASIFRDCFIGFRFYLELPGRNEGRRMHPLQCFYTEATWF